ncbi:uncharacterized protein LOC116950966 isoform X2 [Petromyzon marinus]|uniref:uncharacterized protein LOC116950966 isoform X2 n=1 Tax=Petromyzon marinus TaxID=7757 RepID=UPI003F7123E8
MAAGVVRVVQRLRETLEEHRDSIDLSACEMTTVPVAVNVMLAEVADDVRVASLADNMLKSLPRNFLSTFSRLHELHLQGNQLKSLPDAVASLTELHFINISRNCFVTFPDTLTATPSLRSIDVSHNSLQARPPSLNRRSSGCRACRGRSQRAGTRLPLRASLGGGWWSGAWEGGGGSHMKGVEAGRETRGEREIKAVEGFLASS